MAIEVVVPGQLPAEKKMGGKCQYCGCVVRCLQGDARFWNNPERRDSWFEVTCPTDGCGKRVTVSMEEVTDDDLYTKQVPT